MTTTTTTTTTTHPHKYQRLGYEHTLKTVCKFSGFVVVVKRDISLLHYGAATVGLLWRVWVFALVDLRQQLAHVQRSVGL
jgi:hypothetical protein